VGADVNAAAAQHAALVGRAQLGRVAGVQGRAAAQQGVRLGRAAVILQGAEQRGDVEQVGGAEAAAAARVADQVVAPGADVARQIGGGGGRITGDDGVPGFQRVRVRVVVNAAATACGGVAADGGVIQRDRAVVVHPVLEVNVEIRVRVVVNAAATACGEVA